jgi:hypothetical protein
MTDPMRSERWMPWLAVTETTNWIKGRADVQPGDGQSQADQSKPNRSVPSPQTHATGLGTSFRAANNTSRREPERSV